MRNPDPLEDKARELRRLLEKHLLATDSKTGFTASSLLTRVQREATVQGIWDPALATELFHEFVLQGIVAVVGRLGVWIGSDPPPECVLTRRGREALLRAGPSPRDPEGYVRAAMEALGGPDIVVERVLSEAVGAFNGGHHLASAAMLGFACERVVRSLAVEIHRALTDSGEKSRFGDKAIKVGEGKRGPRQPRIGDVMDQIQGVVERGSLDLPAKIRMEARSMLEGIFELVTKLRDSVAHDDDPIVTKAEIEARLLLVPFWLGHVREMRNVIATRSRLPTPTP